MSSTERPHSGAPHSGGAHPGLGRRAVLAMGLAPLLGAAGTATAQPAQGELKIGALFPFSGPAAVFGDEAYRGVELAAEERNAAGGLLGLNIRLMRGDAADATTATAEAKRLIGTEKTPILFGTGSTALATVTTQIAELAGTTYFELNASADPLTERSFHYLYRYCTRASDVVRVQIAAVTEALAPLWKAEPRSLKIAILQEDGALGQVVGGLQEAALKAGGLQQVERVLYSARAVEMSNAVARLKGSGADVVLHTGFQNDIVLFYRSVQEAGWKPRMVVATGPGYMLPDTAHAVGPAFNGVVSVDIPGFNIQPQWAPAAVGFAAGYQRKYGADPRCGLSLESYVGARQMLDAVQRAGSVDKDKIHAAVLALDVAEGQGNGWGAKFDDKGQNLRAQPVLQQWQDGKLLTVGPAAAAVAELRGRFGS